MSMQTRASTYANRSLPALAAVAMVVAGALMSAAIAHSPLLAAAVLVGIFCAVVYFRPIWGLYALAVLVPWQLFPIAYLPGLPYASSVAHVLVVLILVTTLVRALTGRITAMRRDPIGLLVLLYAGSFFLSVAGTDESDVLLRDVIPLVLAFVASYYALVFNVAHEESVGRFVLLLLLSCSVVAGVAMLQYVQGNEAYIRFMSSRQAVLFGGEGTVEVRQQWLGVVTHLPYTRVGGIFMNPEQLGGLLLFPFLMSLPLALRRSRCPHARAIYTSVAALCGLGLVCSMTRSAWLGAACGTAVLVILDKRRMAMPLLLLVVVGCAAFLAAGYSQGNTVPSAIQARLGEMVAGGFNIQVSDRYQYFWLPSLRAVEGSWLVGYGTRFETHSLYLTVLLQTGVVGLASFSLLLAAAFHRLYGVVRRPSTPFDQDVALGLTAALVGWLAHSAFYADVIFLHNGMLLFICLGLVAVLRPEATGARCRTDRWVSPLPAADLVVRRGLAASALLLAACALAVGLTRLQPGPLDLLSYASVGGAGVVAVVGCVRATGTPVAPRKQQSLLETRVG